LGWLSPPKTPRGDGTGSHLAVTYSLIKCIS